MLKLISRVTHLDKLQAMRKARQMTNRLVSSRARQAERFENGVYGWSDEKGMSPQQGDDDTINAYENSPITYHHHPKRSSLVGPALIAASMLGGLGTGGYFIAEAIKAKKPDVTVNSGEKDTDSITELGLPDPDELGLKKHPPPRPQQ